MPPTVPTTQQATVAAATPAEKLPLAKDMTPYLSSSARVRGPSPLKSLIKYMGYPNMISLGGGE
jgi:hypothetical protein